MSLGRCCFDLIGGVLCGVSLDDIAKVCGLGLLEGYEVSTVVFFRE